MSKDKKQPDKLGDPPYDPLLTVYRAQQYLVQALGHVLRKCSANEIEHEGRGGMTKFRASDLFAEVLAIAKERGE